VPHLRKYWGTSWPQEDCS